MSEVRYSVNGKYFKDWNVYVSDSEGLFDALKRKKVNSYDWAEYHGQSVDLSKPKFEAREITLKGFVAGDNWEQMKANFDVIISEFQKAGTQRLLIEPFGLKPLPYEVYMEDQTRLEKTFKKGQMVGVFSMKLIEPNPIKKVLYFTEELLNLSYNSPLETEIFYGNSKRDVVNGSVYLSGKKLNKAIASFTEELTKEYYIGLDIKKYLSGRKKVLVHFYAKSNDIEKLGRVYLATNNDIITSFFDITLKTDYSEYYVLLDVVKDYSTTNFVNISLYSAYGNISIKDVDVFDLYPYSKGDNIAKKTSASSLSFLSFHTLGQLTQFVGKNVTVSFDMKTNVNSQVQVYPYQGRGFNISQYHYINSTTEWTHYSFTDVVINHGSLNPGTTAAEIGFYSSGKTIDVRNLKIEIGETETPFSISPNGNIIVIAGNIDEITNLQTNAEALWELL